MPADFGLSLFQRLVDITLQVNLNKAKRVNSLGETVLKWLGLLTHSYDLWGLESTKLSSSSKPRLYLNLKIVADFPITTKVS